MGRSAYTEPHGKTTILLDSYRPQHPDRTVATSRTSDSDSCTAGGCCQNQETPPPTIRKWNWKRQNTHRNGNWRRCTGFRGKAIPLTTHDPNSRACRDDRGCCPLSLKAGRPDKRNRSRRCISWCGHCRIPAWTHRQGVRRGRRRRFSRTGSGYRQPSVNWRLH